MEDFSDESEIVRFTTWGIDKLLFYNIRQLRFYKDAKAFGVK